MATNIAGTEIFTNGPYQKPEAGDAGDEWATVLEGLIDRITTHSHQGADSKTLTLNISRDTQDLSTAGTLTWTPILEGPATTGYESNTIDMTQAAPSGLATFDGNTRHFYKLTTGGYYVEFYPTIEKITATTYKIITNEAIATIRIIYI